jgi:signal transduction histidine kinase
MLTGDLQYLREYFSNYVFISQTLYTTINFLSAILGFFFLAIGFRTQSKAYFYSGMTTITWSLLISMALTSDLPTATHVYWRLALYAATGMLIYFVSMFTMTVFRYELNPRFRLGIFIYLNLGWVIYALAGSGSEQWLDIAWTGIGVCIYVTTAAWVIYLAIRARQFTRVLPIAIHWLTTSVLACHDYILQSGVLPFALPEAPFPMWANLILQPIYMTHIALPVFVVMAMWLLVQDHYQKSRNELQHVKQLNEQRERIVSDIHDGVGSRINLLLWSLRTEVPSAPLIESELQRCMEELRFAINPITAGHETLHKALQDLCIRLKTQAHDQGIELDYARKGQARAIASEIGLHLYKATQECLSNALRHSEATHIKVELTHSTGMISICVYDNGTGIPSWDDALQRQTSARSTSMGLLSLGHRIRSKGGQCTIHSNREGTSVLLQIPLPFAYD